MPYQACVKIALSGKTGAGKTTVAKYLEARYGFLLCNTGLRCRELAREFFDSEDKYLLNAITDAFRALEPGIWLKIALRRLPLVTDKIVIDSIRFLEDSSIAREESFFIWKIKCRQDVRVDRLRARGQIYNASTDEEHVSETALDYSPCDVVIENDSDSLSDLYYKVERELRDIDFIS